MGYFPGSRVMLRSGAFDPPTQRATSNYSSYTANTHAHTQCTDNCWEPTVCLPQLCINSAYKLPMHKYHDAHVYTPKCKDFWENNVILHKTAVTVVYHCDS